MLLSFTVGNYRCIRESVTLECEAINYYKELRPGLLRPDLPGTGHAAYLPIIAIYGANASGKTTFLEAMGIMRDIVLNSVHSDYDSNLRYMPFKFDDHSSHEPTSFRMEFVAEGIRYELSFSYANQVVVSETLYAYPKGQRQTWYTRIGGKIRDSAYLRIPDVYKALVNDDVLLLSWLGSFENIPAHERVRPIMEWFSLGLDVQYQGPESLIDFPYTGSYIEGAIGSDAERGMILGLVENADLSIAGLHVETKLLSEDEAKRYQAREKKLLNLFGMDPVGPPPQKLKSLLVDHLNEDEDGRIFTLPFAEESDGTKQFVGLASHVVRALEHGGTLVVDELDNSLHPQLLREVVRCFSDPDANIHGAQLIFNAHDTSLLDSELLRRDEIWFTMKNKAQCMELIALSDFKPRQGEALSRGYLSGRYGAVPHIDDSFGLGADERQLAFLEAVCV